MCYEAYWHRRRERGSLGNSDLRRPRPKPPGLRADRQVFQQAASAQAIVVIDVPIGTLSGSASCGPDGLSLDGCRMHAPSVLNQESAPCLKRRI